MEVTFIDKKKTKFGNLRIGETFTKGGETVYMKVCEWGNNNVMPLNNEYSGMALKCNLEDEVMPCKAKLTVEMG